MKKIYCLVDVENGEVVAAAKTRRPLEEQLLDIFMEDFRSEMQEAADAHWIDVINPTLDCHIYARQTWNRVLRWNKEMYNIQKVWM